VIDLTLELAPALMEPLGEARGEEARRQGDHAEPDDRAQAADHFAERPYRPI
jgi:hypothetical protein